MPRPDTTAGASPGPGDRGTPGVGAGGCRTEGSEVVAVFSACLIDDDDAVMSLS